jgi:hypothetical protein
MDGQTDHHRPSEAGVDLEERRRLRHLDSGGRQLRQRVLAAGRRDPQPEGVQDVGRPLEAGRALAQRKVRDHVRCGDQVK